MLTITYSVVGLVMISATQKGDETLWFNQHHNLFADFVFRMLTRLGEVYFIAPIVLFVGYFKSRKSAIVVGVTMLSVGILVQVLKRVVFEMLHRPAEVMGQVHELRAIEGTEMNHFYAFPSGHTAAAFALMFLLSVMLKKKPFTVVFFALAALTGVSRLYLLQHFLSDVIAGALIGTAIAWLINRIFARLKFFESNSVSF